MKLIKHNLEKTKKEFSRNMFLSISIIFLLYFIVSLFFKGQREILNNKTEFYLSVFIFSSYLGFLVSKLDYDFIALFRTILGFLTLLVGYSILFVCHLTSLVYCLLIPILIFVSILYNKRISLLVGLLFIFFCLSAKTIAINLNISHPIKIPDEYRNIDFYNRVAVIVISVYFSLFSIYYKYKFEKIQTNYEDYFDDNDYKNSTINILLDRNKFEKLYNNIQKIIIEYKSFQDSEFSKKKLAKILKTNETYISKALSLYEHKNFKSMLNKYRVEQVIEDFNDKKFKKFTIEYIYLRAGFKQQSTFNRVFKESTGMTPSEYIEKIELEIQN